MASADPSPPEVPQWLRTLPVAPEYHPTLAEFQDPIAYILKIEKEASCYGICKIVPPLPAPPRKNAVSNLNKSFVALTGAKDARRVPPTFATRQQQVGLCPRRPRPVQKPVWQSGEEYSLAQFEAKARRFERAQLKRCGRKGTVGFSELEVEGLFWKAATDKPVVVEYANDIPGSGFSQRPRGGARKWREEDAGDVGDTAWNMRGVSREKGSLLKFMKEEIPGVTSPMVYIAMMFSWFAWHVEDHELHSLNYLHMGAAKTWYGVPRDARFAFEEVVRVHGYGGSVNPLATFALLGEKTTVMSPEVLVGVGIPCCRLVQNAGDFVITFPGSYHCGFSHGYNCGEASNIATPEWLKVAKEAAIRRASINVPPMVSHYQLLYDLALSLWSRVPASGASEPRSSRLKDKFKGEGEIMIKELFVQSVTENNNLLNFLIDKGSSCVVLPQNRFGASLCSNSQSRTQTKMKSKPSLGFCNHEAQEDSTESPLEEPLAGRCAPHGRGKSSSLKRNRPNVGSTDSCTSSDSQNKQHEKENTLHGEGLLEQGLLSCVTCGILSFACVAIIKPTEAAAIYLMCADPESFIDQTMGIGEYFRATDDVNLRKEYAQTTTPGRSNNCDVLGDNLECTYYDQIETSNQTAVHTSASTGQKGPSALDLLASAYGDSSSDVDEEDDDYQEKLQSDEVGFKKDLSSLRSCHYGRGSATSSHLSGGRGSESGESGDSQEISNNLGEPGMAWEYSPGMYKEDAELMRQKSPEQANGDHWVDDHVEHCQSDREMKRLEFESADPSASPDCCYKSKLMQAEHAATTDERWKPLGSLKDLGVSLTDVMPDKDSTRMHVFCLEHAVEVEGKLSQIGGAEVMLVCHPDYPRIEAQARLASKELGINYDWRDINFRSATEDDLKTVKSALEDEETIPMVSDWAVKMCINLYYSANLSKFPLYSQQIPYNPVIYKAFGRNLSGESPGKLKVFERRRGKKLAIAGRWCGKVWTSNQLHPYIPRKNEHEEHDLVPEFEREVDNVCEPENADERPAEVLPDSLDVRTSTRKRKNTPEKSIAKRLRYTKQDSNESPEDSTGHSSGQAKRTLRSGQKSRTSTTSRSKSVKVHQLHKSSVDDDVESGPRTRLRSRPLTKNLKANKKPTIDKQTVKKRGKQLASERSDDNDDLQDFPCNVEGCTMSFGTKQDLALHKRNICPVKGCGKKFFSHKYLVQHRRVHTDDRPLKCPWKGCKMTFKWAWARTEHIRVHTGDRPYICMVGGCGQTFRFVSDFSRHKRKTGHVSKKGRR